MSITIEPPNVQQVDKALARLDSLLRLSAVTKAMNKLGQVVASEARRRVVVGDKRHNPEAKQLKQTIGKVQRQRNGAHLVVVGAQYPAGAHAHFVEGYKQAKRIVVSRGPRKGTDTGLRAVAKPFMAPAVDATRSQQLEAFFGTIEKAIRDSSNGQ